MKVLLWDIETAPIQACVWGLFQQDIHHDSIIHDWFVICASYKWLDEKEVHAVSVGKKFRDDKKVIQALYQVLCEADVIVGHNGDAFDLKKFNARAIFHGLPPIPHKQTVDTLKTARRHFKFTSNRLDYLGQFLGVGKKMDTPKGLWMRALFGDREAIDTMVRYCKQDVLLLEKVYHKLRPHMRNHPNHNLYSPKEEKCCPKCGNERLRKSGFKYQMTTMRRQYQCLSCGGYFCGAQVARVELR